jgi:hypothetical protein
LLGAQSIFCIINSIHLSNSDQTFAGLLAIVRGDMPTHPRKHSDDARIVAKLLKEGAEPRQAASVKKAREKGTLKKSTRSPAR